MERDNVIPLFGKARQPDRLPDTSRQNLIKLRMRAGQLAAKQMFGNTAIETQHNMRAVRQKANAIPLPDGSTAIFELAELRPQSDRDQAIIDHPATPSVADRYVNIHHETSDSCTDTFRIPIGRAVITAELADGFHSLTGSDDDPHTVAFTDLLSTIEATFTPKGL